MDRRLFQAASNGDLQFFEKLTDPSTILQVTIEKNTVLHVAVQFNQLEAARKIVHLNSRLLYEANSKGNTPLHVAARDGSSSLVKLLIDLEEEQELDIEIGRHHQLLIDHEEEQVLDIEIGHQHQLPRIVNRDGDTALHVAARNCKFHAVRELVSKDPELVKYENKAGESALFIAVDRECYRTAFYILDAAPEYCSYAGRHRMNVLHAVVIRTGSSQFCSSLLKYFSTFLSFLIVGPFIYLKGSIITNQYIL